MLTYSKFEVNSEEDTLINGKVKYGGSGDEIYYFDTNNKKVVIDTTDSA